MSAKSEEINELASALVKAQLELREAKLDKKNPHFRSDYASLESVVKTIRPVIGKHGLAYTQLMQPFNDNMALVTTLMHTSGQWMQSAMPMKVDMTKPQSVGSFITYYRRYSLVSMFGIADTADDDDANEAEMVAKENEIMKKAEKPKPVVKLSKEQIDQINNNIVDDADKAWLKDILTKGNLKDVKDIPQGWYPKLCKSFEEHLSKKDAS